MKAHEEEYKGYTIELYYDDDAECPREWDNLGTMVCWHRRYTLGDEQPDSQPSEWLCELARTFTNYEEISVYSDRFRRLEEMTTEEAHKILDKHIIMLPLYLYEHSGITMSTSGFSCPWDSGQVGWIYVSKQAVLDEWGKKRMSKKLYQRVVKTLEGEVATYDQFLTGDVYGYRLFDAAEEELDSCWGFYGMDYCLEEARGVADHYAKGAA